MGSAPLSRTGQEGSSHPLMQHKVTGNFQAPPGAHSRRVALAWGLASLPHCPGPSRGPPAPHRPLTPAPETGASLSHPLCPLPGAPDHVSDGKCLRFRAPPPPGSPGDWLTCVLPSLGLQALERPHIRRPSGIHMSSILPMGECSSECPCLGPGQSSHTGEAVRGATGLAPASTLSTLTRGKHRGK